MLNVLARAFLPFCTLQTADGPILGAELPALSQGRAQEEGVSPHDSKPGAAPGRLWDGVTRRGNRCPFWALDTLWGHLGSAGR